MRFDDLIIKIKNMKNYFFILSLICCLCCISCKKFLEVKPNIKLDVPEQALDFQALLDQYNVVSERDPSSGEVSAGDFYLTDADYLAREDEDRRMYTWQNSNVYKGSANDWLYTYVPVYTANSVIAAWQELPAQERVSSAWRDVAGQAYYLRAKCFLNAATLWCQAYDEKTAANMPGIPLRLNTNFNEASTRATLAESYAQIIADLKMAANLLPVNALHVVRASKPAAFGLLARSYLWMRNYTDCRLYADSALMLKKALINYNTLTASASYPLAQFNTEVIMASKMSVLPTLNVSRAKINISLYNLYETNDLRKTVFFRTVSGTYSFKGNYTASSIPFSGIATDEIYLMRAECRCREGNLNGAMDDLNTLLINRYKNGTFVAVANAKQNQLLELILKERQKELLYRGLRWPDIKRLNEENAGISLSRVVNGITYTLPARSLRFAMPLPETLINTSKLEQNHY